MTALALTKKRKRSQPTPDQAADHAALMQLCKDQAMRIRALESMVGSNDSFTAALNQRISDQTQILSKLREGIRAVMQS